LVTWSGVFANIPHLPDCFKVFRLAFVPIDVGLELFQSTEFRAHYLPRDFGQNPAYLFTQFDIWKRCKNPLAFEKPQVKGHLVLYLLHVRMNAALSLLKDDGLLDWFALCIKSERFMPLGPITSAAMAVLECAEEDGDKYVLPDVAIPANIDRKVQLPSKTVNESLRVELENIRGKLVTYIEEHKKLTVYLTEQIDQLGRIDDIHLLDSEDGSLWATIKPHSTCVGPLFAEDRTFVNYEEKPSVHFEASSGQLALDLLVKYLRPIKTTLPEADKCSPFVNLDTGEMLNWTNYPEGNGPVAEEEKVVSSGINNNSIGITMQNQGRKCVMPLHVLLGDFSGLVWWLRQPKQDDFCQNLYEKCDRFEWNGWGWKMQYNKHVAKALRDPDNCAWRFGTHNGKSYVLLMATQLAVYCAERITSYLHVVHLHAQDAEQTQLTRFYEEQDLARKQLFLERPPQIECYRPSAKLSRLYSLLDKTAPIALAQRELREARFQL
jgi:hypothetical protein